MATGVNTNTFNEQPYITVAEYKNAPTAIDYDNLVVGGNQAAQDAELTNVILRASSYLNEYLNQDLNANTAIETQRVRITPQGYFSIHPNNNPIIAVIDFQYGSAPNNLTAIPDCSQIWFEDQQFIVPVGSFSTSYSSAGPLAIGFAGTSRSQVFIKYTYDSGYANNPLVTATQGATSLVVSNYVGLQAGSSYRIYDGSNSETVTVASTYTYGSTTIPLTTPLLQNHAAGVLISNLPNAIKQATILATTAFLKIRGDNSLTMNVTTRANTNQDGATMYGSELALALDMVDKYRRVR